MPGRKFDAGSFYRYGFNGKENDNDVKGEGNQQDYGMRIYDPRIGRFFLYDPIAPDYPELTPYQFASNRPSSAIDFDGLEAKDLERELEPVRAQRKKEQQFGISYPETRSARYLRYFVTGGLAGTLLAPVAAVAVSAVSASTQLMATNLVLWVSNPANQGLLLFIGEVGLEVINPDPNYSVDLSPMPAAEVVKSVKLLFKTKAGKMVQGTVEDGAVFSNLSEVDWFEKLLSEGNHVRLLNADASRNTNPDFLVNGIRTELKSIAQVTSPKLADAIKTTMQAAINQAGDNGSIIIDVTGQTGATKEMMEGIITRLQKDPAITTSYRIAGNGFELTGQIEKKKQD